MDSSPPTLPPSLAGLKAGGGSGAREMVGKDVTSATAYLQRVYKYIVECVSVRDHSVFDSLLQLRSAVEGVTVDVEKVVAEKYERLANMQRRGKKTSSPTPRPLRRVQIELPSEPPDISKARQQRLDEILSAPSGIAHQYEDGRAAEKMKVEVGGAAVREVGTQFSTAFPRLSRCLDADDVTADSIYLLDAAVSLFPSTLAELSEVRKELGEEQEKSLTLEAELVDERVERARLEEDVGALRQELDSTRTSLQHEQERSSHLDREVKILKSTLTRARSDARNGEADTGVALRLQLSSPQFLSEVRYMIEERLDGSEVKEKLSAMQRRLVQLQEVVRRGVDRAFEARKERKGSVVHIMPTKRMEEEREEREWREAGWVDEKRREGEGKGVQSGRGKDRREGSEKDGGMTAEMREKYNESVQRLSILRGVVKELEKDREELVKELRARNEKCKALDGKISVLVGDRHASQLKLDEQQHAIEKLTSDMDFVQKEKEAMQYRVSKEVVEREELELELRQARIRLGEMEDLLKEVKKESKESRKVKEAMKNVQVALVKKGEAVAELSDEVANEKRMRKEVEEQLFALEEHFEKLEVRYARQRGELDDKRARVSELEEAKTRLEAELEEVEGTMTRCDHRRQQAVREHQETLQQLDEVQSLLTAAKQTLRKHATAAGRLTFSMEGVKKSCVDNDTKLRRLIQAVESYMTVEALTTSANRALDELLFPDHLFPHATTTDDDESDAVRALVTPRKVVPRPPPSTSGVLRESRREYVKVKVAERSLDGPKGYERGVMMTAEEVEEERARQRRAGLFVSPRSSRLVRPGSAPMRKKRR
mmetsp:Transcript_35405/g.92147  ORF Transcript_35405/g.92147 Transcript_35405/m.92147 type:complete len:828 (-) Transcript_35405:1379-3862(-)